jgi:hypothetical protein
MVPIDIKVLNFQTTSNFFENGRQPQFLQIKDDLKYLCKQFFLNGDIVICLKMEDEINFVVNKIIMHPETFKIKAMVVSMLRVT